jgi:uncharacterized protein
MPLFMKILEKFAGLNVLITGATSGIGYELARLFSNQNYTLVLVSRNKEKLEFVRNQLSGKNSTIHVIQADLSAEKAAEQVADEVAKIGITIDILINNAGAGLSGNNIDLDPSRTAQMLRLNVISPTSLSILFARSMAIRKKGYICNVGSMISFFSLPIFSAYAASKAYILNYTRALRTELAPHNVSVTCLLPGFTRTNFDENAQIKSESYKKFSKLIAMDPAKVAKACICSLFNKKALCVPGLDNKAIHLFSHFLPKQALSFIMYRFLSRLYRK